MIETALSEMDEVIAIIYDEPRLEVAPLAVRAGWLRELYPSVLVVEAWDGPAQVGYTTALERRHEQYVIGVLGIQGITHFYSSERYGDHMSRALGAIDRRVDEARKAFPVSATDIRLDPFANRKYVAPLVYRDLVVNVVFLGAPSTGKTTIARHLAGQFKTQWMPEYGREYWEMHQVNRRLTPRQLVEIAEEHVRREDALLSACNRYLFTDTNAITTATFARRYHGNVEPLLSDLAHKAVKRYDLTFVCDIDVPYEDTWDRSGVFDRSAFQRQVLGDLAERKVPFIVLSGSIEQRAARVRSVLERFHKYMNPMDLCSSV